MRIFRQKIHRSKTAKRRFSSFASLFKRYKRKSENTPDSPSVLSVPTSKVMQLYGLDEISSSAKKEVDQAQQYKEKHPKKSKAAELLFWSWIGFSFAQAGEYLSKSIQSIGKILCEVVGYSSVYLHPAMISLSIGKISKNQTRKVGITRYFEAGAMAELPGGIVFFATIGKIIQSSPTHFISIGRACAAAVLSNLSALVVWCVVFSMYWKKAVRGEKWQDLFKKTSDYPKGFIRAISYSKGKIAKSSYEEAGAMTGTGFYVWAMPWYTVRTAIAAILAIKGATTDNFNHMFFSAIGAIEGMSFLLKGMVISRIEKILKAKGESDSSPEMHRP